MDQRPSFWPSVQNLKALGAKIMRLSYASLLRHTPRPAALLRPRKLLNRHCEQRRSRGTPPCPALFGTKSRFTTLVYRTIRRRDDLVYPTLYRESYKAKS